MTAVMATELHEELHGPEVVRLIQLLRRLPHQVVLATSKTATLTTEDVLECLPFASMNHFPEK